MDAAGELPRQARHTPSTRVRPLSLTGAPQGRPSTRRRPSAEPGAPARPPSGSDPRDLRFAEGRIARVGGGAKLSRRCRSSSGLRAPPLRAAAASAAATSGSLCCGRPRGPWLNAGVSFWVRYLWSPAGPGPPVALEVRGRLSAAPYMYVREVCVRLSLGGTPAVSLGCLSITAQGTPPQKTKGVPPVDRATQQERPSRSARSGTRCETARACGKCLASGWRPSPCPSRPPRGPRARQIPAAEQARHEHGLPGRAALAAGSARPTRRAAPGGAASSAPSAEGPPRPRARGAGRAGARGALARRAGSSPAHPPQPAGTRRARHGRGEGARQREQTHRPGKPMPRLGQHGGGRGFDRAASHLGLTQLFSSFSATASGPATRRATRELGSWECVGA